MYLCRSFDQLNRGESYLEAKPAVHIGFLDYTLFEDRPEFYASYKLINVKNNQKYSDSLTLHVVDLSRIDLATEEDKKYHVHEWAMLFKSTSWEEIKMLASKNEYLKEASETIFRMSADDLVRKRNLKKGSIPHNDMLLLCPLLYVVPAMPDHAKIYAFSFSAPSSLPSFSPSAAAFRIIRFFRFLCTTSTITRINATAPAAIKTI